MNETAAMQGKHKILIVDDSPINLAILEEVLADRYSLQEARSGEETLAVAQAFRPDLILLDIMMPGIDGYETCRRIRANPDLNPVRIIMLSANTLAADRLKGYEAGADNYLTKPFEEEELLAKVGIYLSLQPIDGVARTFPWRSRAASRTL